MPSYRVQLWSFDSDYSTNALIEEVKNPLNLGYGSYINDIPEAFFTVPQRDQRAAIKSYEGKAHVFFIRDDGANEDVVWRGILAEHDADADDSIFYAYGYEHYLFSIHSLWKQKWKSVPVAGASGRPINDLWSRADGSDGTGGAAYSPLQWVTTGTIQAPWTTDAQDTALTLAKYRVNWKPILTAFKELVAIATSDTANVCYFEIDYPTDPTDHSATFNFWRDNSEENTDLRLEYPRNVLDWNDRFVPVMMRNKTYGVGSGPRGQLYRFAKERASGDYGGLAFGNHSQNLYLSWVRDRAELKRVVKRRLRLGMRTDTNLWVRTYPGSVPPWRSSAASWELGDLIYTKIQRGSTNIAKNLMMVGEQVVFANGREYVQPMLEDVGELTTAAHEGWSWLAGTNNFWAGPVTPFGSVAEERSVTIPADSTIVVMPVVASMSDPWGANYVTSATLNGVAATGVVKQDGILSGLGGRSVHLWYWTGGAVPEGAATLSVTFNGYGYPGSNHLGFYGLASTTTPDAGPTVVDSDTVTDSGGQFYASLVCGTEQVAACGILLYASGGAAATTGFSIEADADLSFPAFTVNATFQGSNAELTGTFNATPTNGSAKTGVAIAWTSTETA